MKMLESKHKVGDVVYIQSEKSYHIVTKIIITKDKVLGIYEDVLIGTRVLAVEQNAEPRLFTLPAGSHDLINEKWLLENGSIITG